MQVEEEALLGEALNSRSMHDTNDEAHETLSLCDLPLENDQSVEWDQDFSSQSNASNNSTSSEHDYFEFFNPNLNPTTAIAATTTGFPSENIMFCGKLITYKQPSTTKKEPSILIESQKQVNNHLLRWKLSGFSPSSKGRIVNSKNGTKSTTLMHKKVYNTNKAGKGDGSPLPKISFLTLGKAKWYLLLFGISRFSPEIELRDIKSRQRRHHRSPPQSPPPMFRFQNCDEKVSRERNRGWGLSWLICGANHQSTAIAMATIGCSSPG